MGKHPQNRFRKLVIVGSTNKKQHQPGPRWWGPRRAGVGLNQETQTDYTARAQFRSLRMAVMPTLSRGLWLEGVAWIVNFVRAYFITRKKSERGAVVLPFRRTGAMASGFYRPPVQHEFVSKKANGSVGWNSDRGVAPVEGGRG
jgi:hypothetical protein